jgi:hypothetical protein
MENLGDSALDSFIDGKIGLNFLTQDGIKYTIKEIVPSQMFIQAEKVLESSPDQKSDGEKAERKARKEKKKQSNSPTAPIQRFGRKSEEEKARERAEKELMKVEADNNDAIFNALNSILLESQYNSNNVTLQEIIDGKTKD